jgi:uncharacterized protein (DUF433 family)
MSKLDLYCGGDPRDMPAYTLPEAAHYTGVPFTTLRSWVIGRHYPTSEGDKFFMPIIVRPDPEKPLLSFINLVECHVLAAIRRQHRVPIYSVRRALNYLTERSKTEHPLARQSFQTDGLDLFIEEYGQLINVSMKGQLAIRDLLEVHLRRIEHDQSGLALRLYPFTRKPESKSPKLIVIDPRVSFGKSVVVGTGIPTSIIADRYKTGESIDDLAEDYGRKRFEIEEAIRSELQAA